MPSLPTPIILITGCSSGIGYHAAKTCQAKGYTVLTTCRQQQDVQRLNDEGLVCFQLDLACSQSIQFAIQQIARFTQNRIDVLFNNAAFGLPGAVEDLSRDALRFQFETNVFGTQELTNAVIALMRQQGSGKIIYNSSILGFAAMPYRGAYNASKFAIEGLADTLRLELQSANIAVSLIEPGPILSKFRENAFTQFKHWVAGKPSAHSDNYQAMINRLETVGPSAPFTLGPEAVTACLLHAITSSKPKVRYRVTLPTQLFALLKRLLPSRTLDKLLIKAGGDGKR